MPQGFSQRIGRPAAAICATSDRCSVLGAATSTPSSPPARSIASASACSATPASCNAARAAADGSATATTRTTSLADSARRCTRPMRPAPTRPRRNIAHTAVGRSRGSRLRCDANHRLAQRNIAQRIFGRGGRCPSGHDALVEMLQFLPEAFGIGGDLLGAPRRAARPARLPRWSAASACCAGTATETTASAAGPAHRTRTPSGSAPCPADRPRRRCIASHRSAG